MADATDIIASVRDQIPDRVANVQTDDGTFSRATLLRWLNDAGRILCTDAPVIQDWGAIQSTSGMDTYEIDPMWIGVDQVWFDNLPLTRTAVLDDLFTTKVTGRSWWFGPHSIHATPRMHVWPAPNRTGASTTLSGAIGATDKTFTVANPTGIRPYGYLQIESEIILYRNIDTTTGVVTNVLRGQGGTVASTHPNGATVLEGNIFWKGTRTPAKLVNVTDTVEIPQGLWPLLELYILSKVRETEQDHMTARQGLLDFKQLVGDLANKLHNKAGLKQGLQIRLGPPGPHLWGGRVYIP